MTEAVTVKRVRIESIDIVRGVIMIVMALDHVRDFFGNSGFNPTDPARTTIALFFTRWITHFCAPVFFLLTGAGAYLSLGRKSKRELSRFLFTRGLWLIFLELVVIRCFGWQFNFDFQLTMLVVLWALGWAMIVLSALVYLPTPLVTTFGVAMIVSHNLFDSVQSASPLWSILHSPNFILATPQHTVFAGYPLIPWVGVTAAGYGLGQLYRWTSGRREAFLWRLGALLTAAFLVLRSINIYGDPLRWTTQKSPVFTALSFLNTTKYPPSLLFLLMTLGPAMLFLWAVDGRTPRFLRPALAIGKVPLFYYFLHVPFIHLRGHRVLRALWRGALDVRVTGRRPVSGHSAARMGILFADCLSGVGFHRIRALSALPLVCSLETAPRRPLAQLFVSSRHWSWPGAQGCYRQ